MKQHYYVKKHNITFTHDNFKAQCFHQPNRHSFGTRERDIFDVSQTTLNGPPANLESRIGTGEEFYRPSLSLHEWDSICHWEQSRYKLDTLLFDSRMSHEKPPTEFEEQVFAWRYFNSGENNWCLQNCKLTSFFHLQSYMEKTSGTYTVKTENSLDISWIPYF
jgi:hypothetical protein